MLWILVRTTSSRSDIGHISREPSEYKDEKLKFEIWLGFPKSFNRHFVVRCPLLYHKETDLYDIALPYLAVKIVINLREAD